LDVEVLIVSYNSAGMIERCLRSLQVTMPWVTVAIREHGDDASSWARLQHLARDHPGRVQLSRDLANPGFGAGCNALAAASDGRWLIFLNPDAEVEAWPWSPTRPPPTGAIIGPHVIDLRGGGDHAGRSYRIRDEIARSWLRRRQRPPDGTGFVSGACMLVDAESFRRLGGFDDRYFMFYEDIDLCRRANASGIDVRVVDEWRVRHSRSHSTQLQFGRSLLWSYESARRFHGGVGAPLRVYSSYVAIDSIVRASVHAARGDRAKAGDYARLARRAIRDLGTRRRR
jgi:GT2 family glycosyltransferase